MYTGSSVVKAFTLEILKGTFEIKISSVKRALQFFYIFERQSSLCAAFLRENVNYTSIYENNFLTVANSESQTQPVHLKQASNLNAFDSCSFGIIADHCCNGLGSAIGPVCVSRKKIVTK